MRTRLTESIRRHPVAAATATLLGLFACVWLGPRATELAYYPYFAARLTVLEHTPPSASPTYGAWTFRFRGERHTLVARIDARRLAVARSLDGRWVFGSGGVARSRYIRRLVSSQTSDPTVEDLARQTRALRERLALDDAGYAELLVRAVQEIPYGEQRQLQLPVEILADGQAVCSGKSLLLAALLVHEGYDTSVWTFDTQRHATVGIRITGSGFRGSGYALVETTKPSLIGQVDPALCAAGPVARAPQVIAVGGTRPYGAAAEARFCVVRLQDAERRAARLAAREPLSPERTRALLISSFIRENSDDLPGLYEALRRPDFGALPQ